MFRRPLRDDGVTLVELVVVMMLLPIVLGLASTALISSMRLQAKNQMRVDAQTQNLVGFELLSRLLRQATYPQQGDKTNSTIVTVADKNRIVFTSRLGGTSTVSQYQFALVGTDLMWDYVGPTGCASGAVCNYSTPAPTSLKRTLITGVRDATVCPSTDNDGAVFHYYKVNPIDGSLPSTPLTAPVTDATPVTGDLANISVVRISLFTKTRIARDAPACEPLTGAVNLRNGNVR